MELLTVRKESWRETKIAAVYNHIERLDDTTTCTQGQICHWLRHLFATADHLGPDTIDPITIYDKCDNEQRTSMQFMVHPVFSTVRYVLHKTAATAAAAMR